MTTLYERMQQHIAAQAASTAEVKEFENWMLVNATQLILAKKELHFECADFADHAMHFYTLGRASVEFRFQYAPDFCSFKVCVEKHESMPPQDSKDDCTLTLCPN